MRGGLELVVKVVHVVEPVGGMQGRMLREGMTPAQEITTGSPVAGSTPCATAAASTTSSASAATAAATTPASAAVTSCSDCSCTAG